MGEAGSLWYDADIDAVMARTARRPIPRGTISRAEAFLFGLVLACSAVAVLALALNVKAAALLAFTIFFYVVVYTVWLKRQTPKNIVIGGAAGALPPVIGWVAASGEIGLEPLILFLIIFLWTPPHFWALSLNRSDEYARARVPMLPVVAGRAATTRHILIYSALLLPISVLPWALGFVAYQLVNPGAIGWWADRWTSVRDWLHFTPPSWLSASLFSFAVAFVVTLLFKPRRAEVAETVAQPDGMGVLTS